MSYCVHFYIGKEIPYSWSSICCLIIEWSLLSWYVYHSVWFFYCAEKWYYFSFSSKCLYTCIFLWSQAICQKTSNIITTLRICIVCSCDERFALDTRHNGKNKNKTYTYSTVVFSIMQNIAIISSWFIDILCVSFFIYLSIS